MRHKMQRHSEIMLAVLSATLSLIFPAGCAPSANSEPFSPLLLAEWDVGNEYQVIWNPNNKMFLVYSSLNANELNNIQAFDIETFKRTWIAKNEYPVSSVFTRDGQQIIEVDSVN